MTLTYRDPLPVGMDIREAIIGVFEEDPGGKIPLDLVANPEAFFAEYLKIRDKADDLVSFNRSTMQQSYAQMKRAAVIEGKKPWYLVVKPRQVGVTTEEQGESYKMVATGKHKQVMTLAHTKESTETIFRMVNRFYDHMDPNVRPKRSDARTELHFPEQDCLFTVSTAKADSPAHGLTLSRVHLSEAARYKMTYAQMEDLMNGVMEAAANGEIVAESTARGAQGWFYEEFVKAMEGDSQWTAIFLAWFDDPKNAIPLDPGEVIERKDEEIQRSRHLGPWTDEQIKYRRDKQAQAGRLFLQEFPETWQEAFLVSGDCWFDVPFIQSLIPTCAQPVSTHDNEHLIIWHEPEEGVKYYIGADTAEGLAQGDADSAYVLDRQGRQCAALHGHWAPELYAGKLAALGRLYNTAALAVEAQNHGHSVLNTLRNVEKYPKLFVHRDYDADPKAKGKLGWQTTAKTRNPMLDKLRDEAVEGKGMQVNDRHFLNECLNFCLTSDGRRYEARSGAYDDRVMSCAIAWWVRELAPREARIWLL